MPAENDLLKQRQFIVARRQELGMKQAELARMVGISRQEMRKIEVGITKNLKLELVHQLARTLQTDVANIEPRITPKAEDTSLPYAESAEADGDTIPLVAFSSDGFRQVVGNRPRPATLRGVRRGYAVYAPEDCMAPCYAPGWVLYVNPSRPPSPGRHVFVILHGQAAPLVRQLMRQDGERVALRAHTRRGSTILPAKDIAAVHLIVGVDHE